MHHVAVAKSSRMVSEMKTNLAVLLDELIERGGELQVKRERNLFGIGSAWELILWTPPAIIKGNGKKHRGRWPTVDIRIKASTSLELVKLLEQKLNAMLEPEPEPAKPPVKVGEQLALV